MAHYTELDENNTVLRVLVVNNTDCLNFEGLEDESVGISFLKELYGVNSNWKQTSYNSNFRKNYAGIGFTYDATRDAFIPPQPYPSWKLVEETCQWEAPIPYPGIWLTTESDVYTWNEDSQTWDLLID